MCGSGQPGTPTYEQRRPEYGPWFRGICGQTGLPGEEISSVTSLCSAGLAARNWPSEKDKADTTATSWQWLAGPRRGVWAPRTLRP